MANWFMASFQGGAGLPQRALILPIASQISLFAASSVGKCPRVLMILRSLAFTLSIALVVYITRLIAGGKVKKGITCVQARRQAATTVGNFRPHSPSSNASSAASAASALAAA